MVVICGPNIDDSAFRHATYPCQEDRAPEVRTLGGGGETLMRSARVGTITR